MGKQIWVCKVCSYYCHLIAGPHGEKPQLCPFTGQGIFEAEWVGHKELADGRNVARDAAEGLKDDEG